MTELRVETLSKNDFVFKWNEETESYQFFLSLQEGEKEWYIEIYHEEGSKAFFLDIEYYLDDARLGILTDFFIETVEDLQKAFDLFGIDKKIKVQK